MLAQQIRERAKELKEQGKISVEEYLQLLDAAWIIAVFETVVVTTYYPTTG